MAQSAELNRPRRALMSVTDKSRLEDVATLLQSYEYELVASGGTANYLAEHGFPVTEVSDVTGFPEIFGGRVKTLHPKVFGGILGAAEEDFPAVSELGVTPFDVVVVNLYDFEQTVESGAADGAIIEKIDIGGPSLLRAAAKNHRRVCVLSDPESYEEFAFECRAGDGFPSEAFRLRMAAETFARTADYDSAIADWFDEGAEEVEEGDEQVVTLRYGENPHQKAEVLLATAEEEHPFAAVGIRQWNGKELSYNNLIDVIAAVKLVDDLGGVCCAAIKHTNPCGVGTADTPAEALERALRCDPDSAFGGIFAFTSTVDEAVVEILRKRFCEVIVAPEYTSEAMAVLQKKKNLRVLSVDMESFRESTQGQGRAFGELELYQEEDAGFPELDVWKHVGGPAADAATLDALRLHWKVCKHVKSNAIVLGDPESTLGIGAGQMSRVDSTRIAVRKAGDQSLDLNGCVCASDAFFPFADSIETLHEVGVRAVVAPGGSIRDEEVIEAANRLGVTLYHTDRRHFRH